MTTLQRCVVKELERCEESTPANLVDAMFKFIRNETPCLHLSVGGPFPITLTQYYVSYSNTPTFFFPFSVEFDNQPPSRQTSADTRSAASMPNAGGGVAAATLAVFASLVSALCIRAQL